VEKCGRAFVEGIESRKRQINCPRWVGLFRWLRPLFTDAEVAALGRSMSARTEALKKF
jgi:hypothetical protein